MTCKQNIGARILATIVVKKNYQMRLQLMKGTLVLSLVQTLMSTHWSTFCATNKRCFRFRGFVEISTSFPSTNKNQQNIHPYRQTSIQSDRHPWITKQQQEQEQQ